MLLFIYIHTCIYICTYIHQSALGINSKSLQNLFPLSKLSVFTFFNRESGLYPTFLPHFFGGKHGEKPPAGSPTPALSCKATFLPSAEDEDLQRELAALSRCDAVLAISRHEERLLVETYGLPRWKAAGWKSWGSTTMIRIFI